MKKIYILTLFSFMFLTTQAVVRTWVGAGSGGAGTNFNATSNWSPAGNPNNDDLIINMTSAATINVTASITVASIDMQANVGSGSSYCRLDLGSGSNVLTVSGNATFDAINYSFPSTNDYCELDAGATGSAFVFNGTTIFHNGGNGDVHFEADITNPGDVIIKGNATFNSYTYTTPADEPNFVYDAVGSQTITFNTITSYLMGESVFFGVNNTPTVQFAGTTEYRFNCYEHDVTIAANTLVDIEDGGLCVFLQTDLARTFTMGANSTLRIGATATFPGDNVFYDYAIYTMDPTATVRYDGTNQTVKGSYLVYPNLILEGSGTKTSGLDYSVAGDFTNDVTYAHGNDMVTFVGLTDQHIKGTSTTSFYRMTVNKPTGTLFIDRNTISTNRLTLTNGPLDLNGFDYRVDNTALSAIQRTNGYVISERTDLASTLTKSVQTTSGNHLFPFGKSDGTYIPVTYNRVGADQNYIRMSTYPTAADNTPYPLTVTNTDLYSGTDYSNNTVDRFWNIITSGTMNAKITFTYADSEIPGAGENNLFAQWWNSGSLIWEQPTSSITSQSRNLASNTVTANGVSSGNAIWTLSTDGLLPLEITSLEVNKLNNTSAEIKWETNYEKDLSHFIVQKSNDSKFFYDLNTTYANNDGSKDSYYSYVDNDLLAGKSYYRLKSFNKDGSYMFSDIKSISNLDEGIGIYPNPAKDEFNIAFSGDKIPTIKMYNSIGQNVDVPMNLNNNLIRVNTSEIERGVYFININSKVEKIVIK